MYSFTIKIANRIIGIESIHIRPKAICRDFIVSDPPELFIHISQEDIDRDRKEYERVIGYCEKWDGYIETFTLLRKLSDLLIDYGVFLLHGASIAVDEKAIVFVADSGTGKTVLYEMLEDLRLTNEYKAIKLFNYKSDNFSESIEQCRDSFIVVDNADNLINDEVRRFINFEPSNQYMLFLRNCDGLNVSDKSFKVLKFDNNRITLEEEL